MARSAVAWALAIVSITSAPIIYRLSKRLMRSSRSVLGMRKIALELIKGSSANVWIVIDLGLNYGSALLLLSVRL